MSEITPSVGRKVWFYLHSAQAHPMDATVIKVHGNGPKACVNLDVVDPDTGAHKCVPSVSVGDEGTMHPHYRWMPYQIGQAKAAAPATSPQHPLDRIARVCHEVNKAYCEALGDNSQPDWEHAPAWQRESARMGVDLHTSGYFGPEASHIAWLQNKTAEGWVYGPVKDAEAKTHPCMLPFQSLPREQQAKDYIFRAVVHALQPPEPRRRGEFLTEEPDHPQAD